MNRSIELKGVPAIFFQILIVFGITGRLPFHYLPLFGIFLPSLHILSFVILSLLFFIVWTGYFSLDFF